MNPKAKYAAIPPPPGGGSWFWDGAAWQANTQPRDQEQQAAAEPAPETETPAAEAP